jgi:RimJ/RimL family protein N-acetyltransferase
MNATPVLEGYGVRLEPLSHNHLPALLRVATEPSIWRYMSPPLHTEADVTRMIESALCETEAGVTQPWVTIVGDELVGATRLFDINLQHLRGEIGFTWLAKPWRGSGVNPRAKLLQMTHGFETLGLRRIALKTHHENLHSQNAMRKLGAQYEGTHRNHMVMPDGSTRHSAWFSVIAEEWPSVKAGLLQRIQGAPIRPVELR